MGPSEQIPPEQLDPLLEESAEDLYENAPCGYVSALPDGRLVKVNRTLLDWTGYTREDLLGRRFQELLTPGGQIYHETHYAPLLRMQGAVREIALEIVCADGRRLPILVNSVLRTAEDGRPLFVRTTVFDATHRRQYERELLAARERERSVAHSLQQSLLAGDPPQDARFEVAAFYGPAGETLEVGGDWHDTFRIGPDVVGIVVGDVVGRGLDAASAMGQLRSATRALAGAELRPVRLLERLDTFVEQLPRARMATLVYGELDLRTGLLNYACAGHPPPLLARPGRPPEPLWEGRSAPLGAYFGARPSAEATVELPAGSRLLLYTDGLVETRRAPLDTGIDRLEHEFEARRTLPLETLLTELVGALRTADEPEDDVCLLCIEYCAAAQPGTA